MPEEEHFEVTLIVPKTGLYCNVDVWAETARKAAIKAARNSIHDDVYVARSWLRENVDAHGRTAHSRSPA